MQIRINKYLSDCGIASRRKVEEFILQGRVMVNKMAITARVVINSIKVNPFPFITPPLLFITDYSP